MSSIEGQRRSGRAAAAISLVCKSQPSPIDGLGFYMYSLIIWGRSGNPDRFFSSVLSLVCKACGNVSNLREMGKDDPDVACARLNHVQP